MRGAKLKIGFRVDAGNLIGTGHLTEMITLFKEMRKRIAFAPVFITDNSPFTQAKLKEAGVDDIIPLPEKMSERVEAENILNILNRCGCKDLILDLLGRSNKFYGHLKDNLNNTIVIFDDAMHKQTPAALVVNFSITQDPGFYARLKKQSARYLIGPKYFPMNEAIRGKSQVKAGGRVRRIFLNQGGSDPYGLAAKIIRALERASLAQEVDVVVGGALKEMHIRQIKGLRRSLKGNYRFHSNISQNRLYRLLERSDIAISAAGNTLYELAALGVPTMVISHHKKHDAVARAFAKKGAAMNMGIGRSLGVSRISEEVIKFIDDRMARLRLSRKARGVVKGGGAGLLAEEVIKSIRPQAGRRER